MRIPSLRFGFGKDERAPAAEDGDREDEPALRRRRRDHLYRTRSQVAISASAGAGLTIVAVAATGETDFTTFESRAAYLGFTLGLASILALVASITFGFLLYSLQSLTTERDRLYARFKDAVRRLRDFLDEQFDEGSIDDSYDYALGLLDEVTLNDFPLLGPGWTERVDPIYDNVTEHQREYAEEVGTDFGRLVRGFGYRLNDMEEAVNGLTLNWIGYRALERMVGTVVKAFRTLAAVLVLILLAAVYYDGAFRAALWAAAIALGVMTLLLIVEMAMVARRESSGVYPEPGEDGDEEDDEYVDEHAEGGEDEDL